MKAAILKALSEPLAINQMPDPAIGTGEVVVDVAAAPVLSYTNEVFSGERQYPIDLPMVPGCGAIGRLRASGPDATHLKPGDWVFCDPTVRSRVDALMPERILVHRQHFVISEQVEGEIVELRHIATDQ